MVITARITHVVHGIFFTTAATLAAAGAPAGRTRVFDGAIANLEITGQFGNATVAIGAAAPCANAVRGDSNCDGVVNNFDIDAFVLAILSGPAGWSAQYHCDYICVNDTNGDSVVNNFDIDSFVACILNGCP